MADPFEGMYPEDEPRDAGALAEGPLPLVRDPRKPMGPALRKKIEDDVRREVRKHGVLRIACDATGIDPEQFEGWMREDPHLARKIAKDIADVATEDMIAMKKGGRGFAAAKAALESLARTQKEWVAKSRTTLETQLSEALEELEGALPAETYAIVIRILSKHA
jgi:hypothetical protein